MESRAWQPTGEVREHQGYRSGNDVLALPDSDGRVVRLPEVVSIFDTEADNFGFYKVSLFHQLGYVEFGCFSQMQTVIDSLDRYPDRDLAERLFLIAEDARIDWQIESRYPGMKAQLERQKSRAASA